MVSIRTDLHRIVVLILVVRIPACLPVCTSITLLASTATLAYPTTPVLIRSLMALLSSSAHDVCPPALTIDFPVFRDIPAGGSGHAFSDEGLAELHSEPREIP